MHLDVACKVLHRKVHTISLIAITSNRNLKTKSMLIKILLHIYGSISCLSNLDNVIVYITYDAYNMQDPPLKIFHSAFPLNWMGGGGVSISQKIKNFKGILIPFTRMSTCFWENIFRKIANFLKENLEKMKNSRFKNFWEGNTLE